jgi:hypothetical protein
LTLASGKIQVGSDLKLLSANLFQGRAFFFNGDAANVALTSSLPAAVPNPATSTEYGDAEFELPDGGALNFRVGFLSSLFQTKGFRIHLPWVEDAYPGADYFLPNSGVPIYADRAESYDRYYFAGGNTMNPNDPGDELEISNPVGLFYIRDGFDAKLIYRGGNATAPATSANVVTPSSSFGDYGTSFGYYFGAGLDGGLYGPLDSRSSPIGNYRVELLSEFQIVDRNSLFNATYVPATTSSAGVLTPASFTYGGLYPKIASMYARNTAQVAEPVPDFKYPDPELLSVGGAFTMKITNNISIGLVAAWPLGGSRGFMGKTLLGSISITSLSSSSTTPTPGSSTKP